MSSLFSNVTNQPQANLDLATLDLKSIPVHEKKSLDASIEDGHHHCDHGGQSSSAEHHGCHNVRLRRLLVPAILAFLVLGSLLAWSCVHGMHNGISAWGGDLLGRAPEDISTSSQSPFVNRKYYLIVIFVGLVVVVILGICLSAWCCKGAFRNPLCCPCYLCACCGGLACLECIGCGLCAEGLSEM